MTCGGCAANRSSNGSPAPTGTGITAMAEIDWAAAITALDAGHLPCSGGERRMLRLAASIADGTPVSLRDTLSGIDHHNVQLVITAVLHASG
jgi:hypothetical protein